MNLHKFVLFGLFIPYSFFSSASRLGAQQSNSELLTLNAALAYAHEHSPRLSASNQGVKTRQEAIRTAEAERLPRFELGTAFRGTNLLTETALGLPLSAFADVPGNQPFRHGHLNVGVSASLPVYTGGRIGTATQLAQAHRELARVDVRDVERNLDFDVTSTYAQIIELDRDVQAAEDSVTALTETQRVIDQMLSVGKVARVDQLKVLARLADVRSTLISFHDAREIAAGQLNALLGRAIETPIIVDVASAQPTDPVLSKDLDRAALAGSTRYQIALAQLDIAGRSVAVAKSEFRPAISLVGDFLTQSADPFSAYKGGVIGAVAFSFPLWDRTLTHKLEEAKSRELEQRSEVAQAKLDAQQRTRTACLQIEDAKERIRATQAAIDSAREALRIEQEKQRYGRTTIENVLDAQAALLAAQADYDRAAADRMIAVAALTRETGR